MNVSLLTSNSGAENLDLLDAGLELDGLLAVLSCLEKARELMAPRTDYPVRCRVPGY